MKDNKIVYEDINPQLPKTWEEICNQVKVYGEYYIDLNSSIKEMMMIIIETHDLIEGYYLLKKRQNSISH